MNCRNRVKKPLMLLVLALPLAAFQCGHFVGFSRQATLSQAPDLNCVGNAVQSVDAVDIVRYEVREGGGSPPWKTMHRLHVDIDGEPVRFVFWVPPEGAPEYFGVYGFHSRRPPREERKKEAQRGVDTVRPVIIRIEGAIAETCGVHSLTDSVTESCSWVTCTEK